MSTVHRYIAKTSTESLIVKTITKVIYTAPVRKGDNLACGDAQHDSVSNEKQIQKRKMDMQLKGDDGKRGIKKKGIWSISLSFFFFLNGCTASSNNKVKMSMEKKMKTRNSSCNALYIPDHIMYFCRTAKLRRYYTHNCTRTRETTKPTNDTTQSNPLTV